MTGQSIIDLDIRAQFGINIIAIKRGKEIVVSPDPSMNIEFGDILIMIGHDNDLNRFEKENCKIVCITIIKGLRIIDIRLIDDLVTLIL